MASVPTMIFRNNALREDDNAPPWAPEGGVGRAGRAGVNERVRRRSRARYTSHRRNRSNTTDRLVSLIWRAARPLTRMPQRFSPHSHGRGTNSTLQDCPVWLSLIEIRNRARTRALSWFKNLPRDFHNGPVYLNLVDGA